MSPSNVASQLDIANKPDFNVFCLLAIASFVGVGRRSSVNHKELIRWLESIPPNVAVEFQDAIQVIIGNPGGVISSCGAELNTEKQLLDVLAAEFYLSSGPDVTKRRGAVFTPVWLSKKIVSSAMQQWRHLHRSGRQPKVVADLSCGLGSFLYALSEFPLESSEIIGVDIDSKAIAVARLLAFALKRKWNLGCGDSLLLQPSTPTLFKNKADFELPEGYDLLIGNPPYVRSPLLNPSYVNQIRDMFPSVSDGNFDISIAFLEHAIDRLNPEGLASFIVSSKFMASNYGKAICRRLASDVRLLEVEDFQDAQLFDGFTTYTCILTFAKIPTSKRFLVATYPQGFQGRVQDRRSASVAWLPTARLLEHPWSFAANGASEVTNLLRDSRHPSLDMVFTAIVQGVRTGCNDVFVVANDKEAEIEQSLAVPFVNGELIRRGRIEAGKLSLLFPYKRDQLGRLGVVPEAEFSKLYPKAWSHLISNRMALMERSCDEGNPWYAYSRAQNLELCFSRKILVREMMPRSEFAVDLEGRLTFASGYALVNPHLSDDELVMWTEVLNTPTMEFALRNRGTQLQSGWFRLLKHHLKLVRLPLFGVEEKRQAIRYAQKLNTNPEDSKSRALLDNLVAKAFKLQIPHTEIISRFLEDCHARSISRQGRQGEGARGQLKARESLSSKYEPVKLDEFTPLHRERSDLGRAVTFVSNKTRPVHRWYKYTQGFSADLVSSLLDEFGVSPSDVVLDPFAGSGTTNLVCESRKIASIGIEVSPLMVWIANTKISAKEDEALSRFIKSLELPPISKCTKQGYLSSPFSDYLVKAYSGHILKQLWTFADLFNTNKNYLPYRDFLCMGLVSILEEVSQIRKHGSHYRFMLNTENIGPQKLNTPIIPQNSDIRPILKGRLLEMLDDVVAVSSSKRSKKAKIILGDARQLNLRDNTVDRIITSPPYLNRNNYIAQQKAELAILSMIEEKAAFKSLVQKTLCSHVEAHFERGDAHSKIPEVQKILESLSLTEGNNPKIPHMIAGYFDDMTRVLSEGYRVLRPGGIACLVVGNSRWGGVVVPVDHMLMKIGERLGFAPHRILVTRLKGNSPQQMRQYGRIAVRESIVVLKK